MYNSQVARCCYNIKLFWQVGSSYIQQPGRDFEKSSCKYVDILNIIK